MQRDYDKEGAVECNLWYDTGGVGRAENDQKSRVMALASLTGPSTIHTENRSIIDGLWKGKKGCIGPKQKDADLSTHVGSC